MTEIPEHLLRRARIAKERAALSKTTVAPIAPVAPRVVDWEAHTKTLLEAIARYVFSSEPGAVIHLLIAAGEIRDDISGTEHD